MSTVFNHIYHIDCVLKINKQKLQKCSYQRWLERILTGYTIVVITVSVSHTFRQNDEQKGAKKRKLGVSFIMCFVVVCCVSIVILSFIHPSWLTQEFARHLHTRDNIECFFFFASQHESRVHHSLDVIASVYTLFVCHPIPIQNPCQWFFVLTYIHVFLWFTYLVLEIGNFCYPFLDSFFKSKTTFYLIKVMNGNGHVLVSTYINHKLTLVWDWRNFNYASSLLS